MQRVNSRRQNEEYRGGGAALLERLVKLHPSRFHVPNAQTLLHKVPVDVAQAYWIMLPRVFDMSVERLSSANTVNCCFSNTTNPEPLY